MNPVSEEQVARRGCLRFFIGPKRHEFTRRSEAVISFSVSVADVAGIAFLLIGQLVPDSLLSGMIVGDGEGHDVLEGRLTGVVLVGQGGTDTGQREALLNNGFGDAESSNIGGRHVGFR